MLAMLLAVRVRLYLFLVKWVPYFEVSITEWIFLGFLLIFQISPRMAHLFWRAEFLIPNPPRLFGLVISFQISPAIIYLLSISPIYFYVAGCIPAILVLLEHFLVIHLCLVELDSASISNPFFWVTDNNRIRSQTFSWGEATLVAFSFCTYANSCSVTAHPQNEAISCYKFIAITDHIQGIHHFTSFPQFVFKKNTHTHTK